MLTKEQYDTLRQYEETHDGRFLQSIKGSSELDGLNLLNWRGTSWGTPFYSITDAGRAALKEYRDA